MALRSWSEDGCVVVVFEGDYPPASALEAVDAALREAGPVRGLLLDLSDSLSFRSRSADDIRRIASLLGSRRALFSGRLATVGATDLAYGLLRMGTVFVSEQGMQNEAFRTREEALAWLCGTDPGVAG